MVFEEKLPHVEQKTKQNKTKQKNNKALLLNVFAQIHCKQIVY